MGTIKQIGEHAFEWQMEGSGERTVIGPEYYQLQAPDQEPIPALPDDEEVTVIEMPAAPQPEPGRIVIREIGREPDVIEVDPALLRDETAEAVKKSAEM